MYLRLEANSITEAELGTFCPWNVLGSKIAEMDGWSCYKYAGCHYIGGEIGLSFVLLECRPGEMVTIDGSGLHCTSDLKDECPRPPPTPPTGNEKEGDPCIIVWDRVLFNRPDGQSCDSHLECTNAVIPPYWKEQFCPDSRPKVIVDENGRVSCDNGIRGECYIPPPPPPGQEKLGEPCKYANEAVPYIRSDGPSCESFLYCDYLQNGDSIGNLVWKEEFCPEAHHVVVDNDNEPTCVPGLCPLRRPSNWQFPCEKYTSNNQQEIFQDPFDCTLAWTCYYSASLDTWQVTLRNFCENNENGDRFFSKSEDHPLGTTVACTEGCVWHSLSLKIREEEGF